MSSLWKVESANSTDGEWAIFVKCADPFEAMREAAKQKPWDVLWGIRVKAVLDFIEVPETPTTTD